MKLYRVTIDGRVYDVEIDDPRARPVTARLSGTAYSVDIESTNLPHPNRQDPLPEAPASNEPPSTGISHAASAPVASPASTATNAGPTTMTAPIPGVVSKVTVLAGQAVEHGDELLTIEAMKMFNVMRSPSTGTVATVHVKDGDNIVQGQPLVSFAP